MKKTKFIFDVVAWAFFRVKVDNKTGIVYLKQSTTIHTNNLTLNGIKYTMIMSFDEFRAFVDAQIFVQCDDLFVPGETYRIDANDAVRAKYRVVRDNARNAQYDKIKNHVAKNMFVLKDRG